MRQSLSALQGVYEELSADAAPYHKAIARKGSSELTIITDGPLQPDSDKIEVLRRFEEETTGALYAPISSAAVANAAYTWSLRFKIDCDLALAKTGSIAPALKEYVGDALPGGSISRRVSSKKPKNDGDNKPDRRGAKRKKNSTDMLERYKNEPEALEWIREHASELDADTSFNHDESPDKMLHEATDLDQYASLESNRKQRQ